ncbi:MAG: hypothetical protein U1F36_17830 [Planctomycetota bacterium]
MFLVSPEPEKEPVRGFSRRAFWLAVAAAVGVGSVLGRMGARRMLRPDAGLGESISPSLAWALRLQDGPIDGLIENADGFLARVVEFGPHRLESGLLLLVEATVGGRLLHGPDRVAMSRKLAGVIRAVDASSTLKARVVTLDRIR